MKNILFLNSLVEKASRRPKTTGKRFLFCFFLHKLTEYSNNNDDDRWQRVEKDARQKKNTSNWKNDEFFHDQIWTEFKSRVLWKINCDKSFFNHSGPLLPPLLWDCSGGRSLRRVRNCRSRRRRRRRREQACWGWDSRQTSAKENNMLIGLHHPFACWTKSLKRNGLV